MNTGMNSGTEIGTWRGFATLTKVDEKKREVWGRLTQEVVDNSGEIFDYDSSKAHFEQWSADFDKATGGKSLGNLRSMHGHVAAGKLIAINFNDAEKAIDIGTKVVDDNEWEKVLEGVHTGFSVGGKYVKKWKDGVNTRYTGKPNEASLVDKPCVPTALYFDMVKMDGSVEQIKFKEQLMPEIAKTDPVVQKNESDVDEIAKMLDAGTITPAKLLELAKSAAAPVITLDADGKSGTADFTGVASLAKGGDAKAADPASDQATASAAPAAEPKVAESTAKPAVADPAPAADAAAKADGTTKTAEPDAPPEGIAKAAWDALTAEGKAHVLRKGAPVEAPKPVETDPIKLHNAAVEKRARTIATTAFEKGDAAAKAGRVADADWMNYVGEATRMVKAEEAELTKAAAAAPKVADAAPTAAAPATEGAKKADGADDLKKGMYNVQSFASALQSLSYIAYESQYDLDVESDESPVPAQLRAWIAAGVAIFQAMAAEESNELVASLKGAGSTAVIAMAERAEMTKRVNASDLTVVEAVEFSKKYLPAEGLAKASFETIVTDLRKYGARNSAADQANIQNAHDSLAKCGATCHPGNDKAVSPAADSADAGNQGLTVATTIKADSPGSLLKLATEVDGLKKSIGEKDAAIATLTKKVEEIAAQPLPLKGRLRSFAKGDEVTQDPTPADKAAADAIAKSTPGEHNPDAAAALVKAQLLGGRKVMEGGMR